MPAGLSTSKMPSSTCSVRFVTRPNALQQAIDFVSLLEAVVVFEANLRRVPHTKQPRDLSLHELGRALEAFLSLCPSGGIAERAIANPCLPEVGSHVDSCQRHRADPRILHIA